MLLKTGDGIQCDICSATAKEKFLYYSMVYCGIIVKDNIPRADRVEWDAEICKGCYDTLLEQCKNCLKPAKPGSIKCDLCVNYYSGDIKYYKAEFAEVNVDRDATPNVSVKNQVMDMIVCVPCYTKLRGGRDAV